MNRNGPADGALIRWSSRFAHDNLFPQTDKTIRRFLVKKFALAITVLALCCLSVAETASAANANTQQETAAALAQENTAQSAPNSPLGPADCAFTSGAKKHLPEVLRNREWQRHRI
jgi:hypothetical protein